MSKKNEFHKELIQLFKKRTYKLYNSIGDKTRGPNPEISREKVDSSIKKLQEIASTILAPKLAKEEFEENAGKKRKRKIKGRGVKEKKTLFKQWYNSVFHNQDHLVYVFWSKRKCIYVGRTGRGGSRPINHFEKHWFGSVTRIDIYPARSKSHTPKLECLARHHFEPSRNKYLPAKAKYTQRCPLCKVHKQIRHELKTIFRLR